MKTKSLKTIFIVAAVLSAWVVSSCSNDDPEATANKTTLEASLTEAKALLTTTKEGVAAGNYQRGSQEKLQNAIDIAQVIHDLPEVKQATVTGANGNLQAAIAVYKGQIIVAIDPANLVGQWTFDDIASASANAVVKDYSGNNRDGAIKAGHTFFNGGGTGVLPVLATDRYGVAGKALLLDKGANVEIPYNAALNPASISITAWVKLAEVRNNRFVGLHSWNGYKFEVQDGNRPFMTVHSSTDQFYDRDAAVAIGQGAWYHLAVTFTAGTEKFYVNGILVKTWTDTPDPAGTLTTPYNLVLGCDFPTDQYAATPANYDTDHKIPAEWGGYLHGYLDEVRIYKAALSAAQVTSIYDLEKPN
jgi:hypothetical protein